MLTESELKWLRERPATKHTCEDCWKTEAKKSEEFVRLDRYYQEKNGEPWLLSECEWCKWNPNPELADIADGDNWSSKDWYAWDDERRIDYHITSQGRESIKRHFGWGRIREDYKDAAEFEARVAALLTDACCLDYCLVPEDEDAEFCSPSQRGLKCKWCRMMWARLVAEEEMDNASSL